jgi:FHS family L-fucose permease-like MFS transporter
MFPTIFALGIKELGKKQKWHHRYWSCQLLEARWHLYNGWNFRLYGSMQKAYIIPLLCFIAVAWFAWKGYKIKQINVSS